MTGIVEQSGGVTPSGSGHSAEPEPSSTVSAVPVSVPNAERSDEWKRGYAAGCAWYADYIQRITDIRERKSAVLRIAIQKLPEFSAYWSPERRDQWFEWFFDLLEQASAIEARSGETQSGNNNVNCPQTSGYMVPLCGSTEGESAVAKPDAQGTQP